jgi:rhomboid protease GluP
VFKRQRTGSVICASCGVLVGVNDDTCYNCGRRNPSLWGYAPALRALGADLGFVPFVIGTCVIVFGMTLVFSQGEVGMRGLLGLVAPSNRALFLFGASGAIPVFIGERWWTVLSAGWLHGGILHIFMNMMALRQLAPGVADLFGAGRMTIIYTVSGIAGFVLSSFAGAFLPDIVFFRLGEFTVGLRGGEFTVGASASIAGLIGALLAYGHRSGSGMALSYAKSYGLMLVLIGLFFPTIDNYAHAGGFGGGYVTARLLDPMKPERIDHIAIAVLCLVASLVSIVVSMFHGAQFLRQ